MKDGKSAGNWEEDAGTSILEYFIFSYVTYIVMLVMGLFFVYFLRICKGTEKEELIFIVTNSLFDQGFDTKCIVTSGLKLR